MAKRNKLTNSSDEADISSVISGDKVFSIPYFQRAYKWKPDRLKQLQKDLLDIVDGVSDLHFLGAVILHGRPHSPADPAVYEVIDGQQRITTIFLYIAAAVRTLIDQEQYSEAAGLFQKYLVIGRETSLISNLKLHSCKEDRTQLNWVLSQITSSKPLKEKLGSFEPKPLPTSGKENGTLRKNYKTALDFFKYENEQGGLQRVQDVLTALLNCMSVVQIDVWDPSNGPKIFDSLNSRQEPMTIGDLVRNEIFSLVANEEPSHIEQIDQQFWQPFYNRFKRDNKDLFDSYFFPYGLIQDANLKKSSVYNYLRDQWKDQGKRDPRIIIDDLSRYQNAFIDIACGSNDIGHNKALATSLRNLWRAKVPTSTYSFLMQLSTSVYEKTLPEKSAIDILEGIESFLVRRAVCGQEPTGLHAVFKGLWKACDDRPNQELVIKAIRKHRTVVWPNDDQFKDAICQRPLYDVGITPFLLIEFNRSLGGDQPLNIPWTEHILPVNPAHQWFRGIFTKAQHLAQKDLLANLIPLSQEMNASVSNKPYPIKRERYKNDSMFKSARALAETYADWTPERITKRGKDLAAWAVSRWPV
jgi:uncharacterized protein with ParB-like and HNH nuclease domain